MVSRNDNPCSCCCAAITDPPVAQSPDRLGKGKRVSRVVFKQKGEVGRGAPAIWWRAAPEAPKQAPGMILNVRRLVLRRLALAWLVISAILGGLAYYLETERIDRPNDARAIYDYGTNQQTRSTCRYLDNLN